MRLIPGRQAKDPECKTEVSHTPFLRDVLHFLQTPGATPLSLLSLDKSNSMLLQGLPGACGSPAEAASGEPGLGL